MKRIDVSLAASCVLACCALLLLPAGALAQTKGQKLADRLIAKAEATIQAISDAENQYRVTLGAYNSFLGGKSDNNQKAYKLLVKELDRTEKAILQVRIKADDMDQAAQLYFDDWTQSITAITSDELKQRSETRLADTKEGYAKVLETGRAAGDQFSPMLKSIHDQLNYLGQELNPSAIASLADKAQKLNDESNVFFEKIDATLEQASQYVQGIRPD